MLKSVTSLNIACIISVYEVVHLPNSVEQKRQLSINIVLTHVHESCPFDKHISDYI